MSARSKSNELKITRVFDAPLKAVWNAWADPAQAARWWGPRGFTITTHSKDLRPGGTWVYTMHGPDGKDYPNITRYLEVEECARLVYDHGATKDTPPMFRVTVLFRQAADGKTVMDMTMTLPTPEAAETTGKFIKKVGGESTWDRLAEYLIKERSGKDNFVINRSFEAPLERMFELWTNPEHLTHWLPPAGMTMEFLRGDIREGGSAFYLMHSPHVKLYGRAEYVAIHPPHRIVYRQQFCDGDERVARHPLAPVWPETLVTTVELTAEGPDRTRVTLSSEPCGAVTQEEWAAFIKERGGMTAGWTRSFDKLEEFLEQPAEAART